LSTSRIFSLLISFMGLMFTDFVKKHKFNYRWLSKKVHIQGVVDGTFYDAIKYNITNTPT
jgi:hypothetical protein